MMLFIAIALILVGLLCFIYVSLNPNSGNDRTTSLRNPSKSAPADSDLFVARPNSKRGAEILANVKRTQSPDVLEKQKRMEDLFVEGRKIPKQNKQSSPASFSAFESETGLQETEDGIRRKEIDSLGVLDPQTHPSGIQVLEESVSGIQFETSSRAEDIREVRFEIEGILYLDASRDLPYEGLADQKRDLSPELLKGLKRIGAGKLQESKGAVFFDALNSSYRYSFSEIEKILFFDEGIVLIPSQSDYPVPVFFTKEIDSLKSYLEHSQKTILS
ncbi:hypothetical protein EHQ12_04285 [Leptospira gomenensis]|uniref:Uncharacterized protein n=1 Tax=Leptospira gomenensis TaxID=2484974 RepID=A0A5F1YHF1_9LEPT|nr:hypothetical protein [Leptospira gomenensis]TGK38595.1 hypothetical protein EHQ17_00715 [Leptospira gomenensis]TGK42832.1 hypothetical protein EHQ12_04285 [Leptospira gomenensis]TGK49623.1 hypothetical protein EHQ07_04890 [Leptospira gomenensis]TGK60707.1 hypothetical protein EHQ13_10180 [Leptospira gomenensis]